MNFFKPRPRPLNLPETPLLSRADSELLFKADITLAEWARMTDQQRANLRWRIGA